MFFFLFTSKRGYDTRGNSRRFQTWTGAAEQTSVVRQRFAEKTNKQHEPGLCRRKIIYASSNAHSPFDNVLRDDAEDDVKVVRSLKRVGM